MTLFSRDTIASLFYSYIIINCHVGDNEEPTNTRNSSIVGSMLGHRLRRWSNIEPTMDEFIMFVRNADLSVVHVCIEHDKTRFPTFYRTLSNYTF